MKRRRLIFAILAVIMALLLIVPMLTMIFMPENARAVTQADIDALQAQQAELKRQQEIVQTQIEKSNKDRANISYQKSLLDKQVEYTQSRIDNFSSQITEKVAQIAVQQKKYDDALSEEKKMLELFKKQLRSSEELGNVSYLSVLFGAKSFSDMLGMLDFMSQVYGNEQDTVNKLKTLKAEAEKTKNSLEDSKGSLEAAKSEQQVLAEQLTAQVTQAQGLIKQLDDSVAEDKEKIAELEAEEQALAEEILRRVKELDRQNGGTNPAASGNYIWPSDCRYITSPFGNDLLNGVWRKHNGVDIGASYGTSIYASDGGEVVSSTYSSSYGNYIMISHGNGRYTLYAHMSQRLVDVGEKVYQGEVIGKVGSTGYSFGAHIHFEIIEDGAYVSPLDYLNGYVQSW